MIEKQHLLHMCVTNRKRKERERENDREREKHTDRQRERESEGNKTFPESFVVSPDIRGLARIVGLILPPFCHLPVRRLSSVSLMAVIAAGLTHKNGYHGNSDRGLSATVADQ